MKEYKVNARKRYKEEKDALREFKDSLKTMDKQKRKTAKVKFEAQNEVKTVQRVTEVNKLHGKKKKLAKKEDRYIKKLKRRPIKYVFLAVLFVCFCGVSYIGFPYVRDVYALTKVNIDSENSEAVFARETGEKLGEVISDEGIVLLKNDDSSLPLMDNKLNVFSLASNHIRLAGGGSGAIDASRSIDFYEGLDMAGIEYNAELHDLYVNTEFNVKTSDDESSGIMSVISSYFSSSTFPEPDPNLYLTYDIIENAKNFSKNAIVFVTRESTESSDAEIEDLKVNENTLRLIEILNDNFSNVIVVVNSGNAMELGFLNDFDNINSALMIGTPGPRGALSLANILCGKVNPSGRLTDTYVYDNSTAPASENFGDYQYQNMHKMAKLEYEEGIYVGYRYYETVFEDNEEGYHQTVQFPFGYGLSYTDFEWEVVSNTFDRENIKIEVKVTNIGENAGKEVVQVYCKPPYTEGGIEKSSILLTGYAKTGLLEKGDSEIVTIEFATRDMASYDMYENEAYVLEQGNYEFLVSKNVHEHLYSFNAELGETIIYKNDSVTNAVIENQFDYANGGLTYLSRSDFEGTYPSSEDISFEIDEESIQKNQLQPEVDTGEMPTTNADNGLVLADMKGIDINDEKWNVFVEQFTTEEMMEYVTYGGWRTLEVERLGVPPTVLLDGPAGINFFFKKLVAAGYPSELVVAQTWNDDLAYKMGKSIGSEANALGVHGWYAPGMNIHRTAQGGRNFEYFSEDPLLSGKMGANMIDGAQSKDIIVFMKHFALNEQEINARSGVMVWANEQAIREIYLRPFEISVKEGGAKGAMSSFIHIGPTWSGANSDLLIDVLRTEWGFDGFVTSDAVLGSFMNANNAIRNGNELMLTNITPSSTLRTLKDDYSKDPVGTTKALQNSVKNVCYSIVEYTTIFK
ncbi:MAG: glycoside hydrolase family 3 protein [Lachnospirales bacterium]